jgi:hypothetical protein
VACHALVVSCVLRHRCFQLIFGVWWDDEQPFLSRPSSSSFPSQRHLHPIASPSHLIPVLITTSRSYSRSRSHRHPISFKLTLSQSQCHSFKTKANLKRAFSTSSPSGSPSPMHHPSIGSGYGSIIDVHLSQHHAIIDYHFPRF